MRLSREQMLDVINKGGSIMLTVNKEHKHFTLDNIAEFPTVADLALGDTQAEDAARAELDAKLAELLAEKEKLSAKKEEVKSEAKPADDKKAKKE